MIKANDIIVTERTEKATYWHVDVKGKKELLGCEFNLKTLCEKLASDVYYNNRYKELLAEYNSSSEEFRYLADEYTKKYLMLAHRLEREINRLDPTKYIQKVLVKCEDEVYIYVKKYIGEWTCNETVSVHQSNIFKMYCKKGKGEYLFGVTRKNKHSNFEFQELDFRPE